MLSSGCPSCTLAGASGSAKPRGIFAVWATERLYHILPNITTFSSVSFTFSTRWTGSHRALRCLGLRGAALMLNSSGT